LGTTRLLSYNVRGHKLHVGILLPSTYVPGKPVPTIVYPYGGSVKSQEIWHFGAGEGSGSGTENLQVLATRGFAVLLPDTPYFDPHSPIEDDVETIMPAIDAAVTAGFADPNRLGIMGHSHGGYDVYAMLVRSHRFKAAVVRAGPSDLITLASGMMPDGYAIGILSTGVTFEHYFLGADPWSAPQRYMAESPLFLFQKVTTPVLIVQGRNDSSVPPFAGEQSFAALRYLHKNVELVEYPNANHVESGWTEKYQLDYLERVIHWFDHYLCPDRKSPTEC
jgi:dipeptidyl aminopeptidase/acylaminoacyl peptidase